jgi:hypothetical protein
MRVGAGFGAGIDHPNVGKPALRRCVLNVDRQRLDFTTRRDRRQGGFPDVRVIDARAETRPYTKPMPPHPEYL